MLVRIKLKDWRCNDPPWCVLSLRRSGAILLAVQALLVADASAMAVTLTSTAFKPGDKIPSKYICEGDDISPPLAFGNVPQGTKSLALIIDDPDAPDPKAPKRVWAHWLVYNLPPDTKDLPEDASRSGLPKGTVTGLSDRKQAAYEGRVRQSDATAISTSSTPSTPRCRLRH